MGEEPRLYLTHNLLEWSVFTSNNLDAFVVMFSVVHPDSFQAAKQNWVLKLRVYCPETPNLLVESKTDLQNDSETLNA